MKKILITGADDFSDTRFSENKSHCSEQHQLDPNGDGQQIDVVIVNCFETLEHRVELLKRYFMKKGKRVHVITSDWEHFHKRFRSKCPEGYELIHVRPYNRNLSVDRLMSHHYFAQEVLKRLEEIRPKLIWTFVPPNSLD